MNSVPIPKNSPEVPISTVARQLSERVRSAKMHAVPWRFSYLDEALPNDVALRLSRVFGQIELVPCERKDGSKPYRFLTATLDEGSRVPDDQCMALLDFLRGEEYRALMSELTGVPLDGRRITLNLWEYQTGDWLAPHVDKPDKLLTQIFYLTEDWSDNEGGRLLILSDSDLRSLVHALPPRLGSSAVIVRSDVSWHAVERIPPGAAPRKSMTVTFWKDGSDSPTAGLRVGSNSSVN